MRTPIALILFFAITAAATAQPVAVSTSKNTDGVSLTIYNQNFAIVREKRSIDLQSGVNFLRYEDVAAQIDPTSISFKSLTAPSSVAVREQNYQYDLLNPTSIINKSVGKQMRFRRTNPDGKVEIIEGVLLNPQTVSTSPTDAGYGNMQWQGLVIRTSDGKLILNPSGEITVDELPEGLVSRPSLLWKLDADKPGKHSTEASYLTNGITWKADYVAVVNNDETKVDITGWVTIDNRSGATYNQAQLQLMAGDVRRVQEQPASYAVGMMAGAETSSLRAAQFAEESFFEYHLYTLDGKTTVNNSETKQMTLLTANGVSVKRKLIYDGLRDWRRMYGGRMPGEGGSTSQDKVNVVVELKNSKDNNMGMPLPKGKVRVYKADSRENLQFLGEDLVDHTPKDETLKLYIGDAFDVVGERKRTDYRKISDRSHEETFEIKIRNHKETSVEVYIIERLYADWKVLRQSHEYNKIDSHTIEFPISVPKDGEVKVTYTVHTKW